MIVRTQRRRRHPLRLALALLLVGVGCLIGAILAFNLSPHLFFPLLGLQTVGPLSNALPSEPALLTLDGEELHHVDVAFPPQVVEPRTLVYSDLGVDGALYAPLVGDGSKPGVTRYLLTVDEERVDQLFRAFVPFRGSSTERYHNVAVDLEPGGLIVFADVDLGILQRRMGMLLLQDPGTLTLSPAGLVLDGMLYAMPDAPSPARLLLPTGHGTRRALDALTIVGPLPGEARVEALRLHQDRLQILAQATYAASPPADTGWLLLEQGVELREIDVASGAGQATERLSIARLDPEQLRFWVRYDPADPKTIAEWGSDLNSLLVVNGGYFAPEGERGYETTGLLISDGQRWGTVLQDYAGMLAVTGAGEVSVRWLRDWPYDPAEPVTQAVQSFPVLVKPGGMMGFPATAGEGAPARRTVVAQDRRGRILLIVAPRGVLSLHELAVFLAGSDMGIDVALNLDGGGSTGMWLTTADKQVSLDSYTPVPSVVVVERR